MPPADWDSDDWDPIERDRPAAPARPVGGQEGRKAARLDNRGASVPGATPKPRKKPANVGEKAPTTSEDYAQYGALADARMLFRSVGAKSVSFCGLRTLTGSATLERGGGKAGIRGVSRCSSPWLCPVCGPKIAAARAAELTPQFKELTASGWSVWLVTLTLQHKKGDRLADLFDMLAKGWNRFRSGRGFQELRDEAGGFEYVRGYDLTVGRHGWHPHLHLVVALGPGAGDGKKMAPQVLERWRECLDAVGGKALDRALDIQPARNAAAAAAYAMTLAGVSKHTDRAAPALDDKERTKALEVGFSTLAEATAAAAKRGRAGGGETAADLRERAVKGDKRAYALFAEYVAATKGRRAVVVSQRLRLQEEKQAAQKNDVVEPEVVAVLRDKGLRVIDKHLPAVLAKAADSLAEGRRVLVKHLGAPGPASSGALWSLPDDDAPTSFDPSTTRGEFKAAMAVQMKAEREAIRARKKARKAARKKAREEGRPPPWPLLAETEAQLEEWGATVPPAPVP